MGRNENGGTAALGLLYPGFRARGSARFKCVEKLGPKERAGGDAGRCFVNREEPKEKAGGDLVWACEINWMRQGETPTCVIISCSCVKPEGTFYVYPSIAGAIGLRTPAGTVLRRR